MDFVITGPDAEHFEKGLELVESKWKIVCDSCSKRFAPQRLAEPPKNKLDRLIEKWIPLDYRDTDFHRLQKDRAAQYHKVKNWQPGPHGLFLFGPSRRHKSRIAYWLALTHLKCGKPCMTYDSRTFRGTVEQKIMDGTLWEWYQQVEKVPVLLLDDLGKFKGEGKRIEEELFSLIKLRVEARQSIIITTNDTPAQLSHRFSDSIAGPMLERIKETCDIVSFFTREEAEKMQRQQTLNLHRLEI